MSNKKFRNKRKRRSEGLPRKSSLQKEQKRKWLNLTEKQQQFTLSEDERVTCVYKSDEHENICEVTCVSYDIQIGVDWVTIVYYDTFHDGILHRHTLVELDSKHEVVDSYGIKIHLKTIKDKLTWAMSDVRKRHSEYRRSFIKRNKRTLIKKRIDIF